MCSKHKHDGIIKCIVLLSSLLLHSLPLIGLVGVFVCLVSHSLTHSFCSCVWLCDSFTLLNIIMMMIMQSILTMTMKSSSWPIELNRAGYSSPQFSFLCVCNFFVFFLLFVDSLTRNHVQNAIYALVRHYYLCLLFVFHLLAFLWSICVYSFIYLGCDWVNVIQRIDKINKRPCIHTFRFVICFFHSFVYCVVCATNVDERPRMLCAFLR